MATIPDWLIRSIQDGTLAQTSLPPALAFDPNAPNAQKVDFDADAYLAAKQNMSPAPASVPKEQAVSVPPPPPPLNYTPAPPQAEQTVSSPWLNPEVAAPPTAEEQPAPAQPSAQDIGDARLANFLATYARGTQQVRPEGIAKAGEQWTQSGPSAMPGRTPEETGANRAAYEQAKTEREETENEALLDQRLKLQGAADRADEAARFEYLRGRGQADRLLRVQEEQAQRKIEVDRRIVDLDQDIERMSKAQLGNPAKDYWTNMSTFGRIATALSLGLGAAGQALAGGQNVALELVNKEIDSEVGRQRALVEQLGMGIAAKRTILGMTMAKFMSPEAAQYATESILRGQAEAEYRRQAAKATSAEAADTATAMADNLALARAQDKEKALTAEHQTAMAWHPAQVVGQPGGIEGLRRGFKILGYDEKSPEYKVLMAKAISEGLPAAANYMRSLAANPGMPTTREQVTAIRFAQERQVQIPEKFGGGVAQTSSISNTKQVQEGLNAADDLVRNIERIEKLVVSGSIVSPTDRMMVEQIAAQAMGSWRVRLGLGVMSESDKELVKPLTGQFVNSFVNAAVSDQLRILGNVKSLVEQGVDIARNQMFVDPMLTQKLQKPMRARAVK
jgi:hypothetical protein